MLFFCPAQRKVYFKEGAQMWDNVVVRIIGS